MKCERALASLGVPRAAPVPPNAAIEALPCQVVRSQIKYQEQTEPDLEGSSELSTTSANTGATASSPPTSQAHLRCFDEEERAEVTEGFWTEMSVLHDWDSTDYGPEYLSLVKGELLRVWSNLKEGWSYAISKSSQRRGWFPPDFAVPTSVSIIDVSNNSASRRAQEAHRSTGEDDFMWV